MSATQHTHLADTMWHLTALVPWFGAAEAADPQTRHPTVAVVLRRLQQEQQDAIEAQIAMTRSAVDHLTQAAGRLASVRGPRGLLVAQTGFGLALAELATGPVCAWLDAIPKLHECCVALVDDPPAPRFAPPAPAAEAKPAQVRTPRHAPPAGSN